MEEKEEQPSTTKLLIRKVGRREEGRWYKSIIQGRSAGSECINER